MELLILEISSYLQRQTQKKSSFPQTKNALDSFSLVIFFSGILNDISCSLIISNSMLVQWDQMNMRLSLIYLSVFIGHVTGVHARQFIPVRTFINSKT